MLEVDNTQIRYPVLIDEVALALEKAIHKTGIIHMTSDMPVTKYKWAKIIAKEFNLNESLIIPIQKGSLDDRPRHVHLKTESEDYVLSDVTTGTMILKKQRRCVFQLIYKSHPSEKIYGINIGKFRYDLGKSLGDIIPIDIRKKVDYVVPVPTSGIYYAIGLAESIHIPYLQAIQKVDTFDRTFQIADISLREQMLNQKLIPIREFIEDKSLILVDEAIFTGTTLRVACDMVKACGAKEVYVAIPSPICRHECRQYVQPKRRLLSQDFNEEGVANYLKVKQVFFQNYITFKREVDCVDEEMCHECFFNENASVRESCALNSKSAFD